MNLMVRMVQLYVSKSRISVRQGLYFRIVLPLKPTRVGSATTSLNPESGLSLSSFYRSLAAPEIPRSIDPVGKTLRMTAILSTR